MLRSFVFLSFVLLIFSCKQPVVSAVEVIHVPSAKWIDSLKQSSDTVYSKFYQGQDFSNAEYYLDKKDSVLTQVMKDTAGNISQIIKVRKGIRTGLAQYFPNGQLMAKFELDSLGKISGFCRYYYEDGRVRAEGNYEDGFRIGVWRNYNEKGELSASDQYDSNGQLKETTPAK